MATYLVTGVAGFIAAKVAELLLASGHTIVGVDSMNDAYDVRLKQWRLMKLKEQPGLTFHQLDICSRDVVQALFENAASKFDAVINLAARAGVRQSVADPWAYIETNLVGTLNLLEMCRAYRINKFVLASTSSLYGAHNSLPYHESQNTDLPLSPYAASKKAAEALCYTYHSLYGLDVAVCRYFTVYGPAGRPDMSLFRFVQRVSEGRPVVIYGDGNQVRDFTYVDDIARGTLAALRPLGYAIINLGCDKPVVLREALSMIERLVGRPAQIDFQRRHPADVPATWADITRARELLGWEPQTNIVQGIDNLVRWYRENREWASQIKIG